ncbi:putative glycosyltransferase (family 2) [Methanocella arvoryzae MRE50]|uniref:Glycosyltransferase (Family 2) n=1 Tax=Methanocella arvoryzae (strain DSM 22066 / NBRC 105507 / MRE50) TaxID=351160 RepID=Q0W1H0_METAR|nr:putative glycosyltransferase (family 2) [Methanocella arvoryzae MRE50]
MGISVVIPAYNEENYIERCLKSLSCQDYRGDYEIIISDDCSTDNTAAIADKYADLVIRHPKCDTIASGRQIGAKAAKYPVLAFSDADTYMPPGWLSSIASSFEEKDVVGMYGNLMPMDGNRFENGFCRYVNAPYSKFMARINNPAVAGANFAVTREAFDKAGGFDESLVTGEDIELCKRIKRYGRFVFNPDSLVYVSMRRVREWGYARFVAFHVTNTIKVHGGRKGHGGYEPIR